MWQRPVRRVRDERSDDRGGDGGVCARVRGDGECPEQPRGGATHVHHRERRRAAERRTLTTSSSFSIYEEPATVTSTGEIRNGAILDVGAGYRVWRHVALAVSVSTFGRSGGSALTATIPDPIVYGRPRTVTSQTSGLEHTERGVNAQVVWFIPVSPKIEVALSAGPSLIYFRQQLTPTVTVPTNTQEIDVTPVRQSGIAKGANAGFQGTYLFTPRYGVDVFARYAGGVGDLPAVSSVTVGGFQTGLGFTLRF